MAIITATWPAAPRAFTTHVDLSEIVYADYLNAVQVEIAALENTLGYNPQLSSNPTYTPSPIGATVANRLTLLEQDITTRLGRLERLTLNASVGVYLGSSVLVGSSSNWQSVLFTQTDQTTSTNLINPALPLYDNTTPTGAPISKFNAIAPDQTAYLLAATLTWSGFPTGAPAGHRGIRIVGSDGRVYGQRRYPAVTTDTDNDLMSLSWAGVLPLAAMPPVANYYLSLQVFNDSGQSLTLLGDSPAAPCRADFNRIPG